MIDAQLPLFHTYTEPITHGLIVREPWASMILSGQKSIEIRGTNTKTRGPIAIIPSGTGTIAGVVYLVNVTGPLDLHTYNRINIYYGNTKEKETLLPYKRTYAWQLTTPYKLPSPLPYTHPTGAVIWVKLDENVQVGLQHLIEKRHAHK
ncbi:ASCH domain-containing protein [Shouchella lonarensis]|uniref:ASCH domain-containing protein n=1 Tax=Shouchella lonarensis TaxID=1464122 RepID=A0A1G6J7J4_9BACI|nr:ASCH domain-containing protein [Shouchella lonarensis]SDC13886.1 ASCH domain-containing protein [Shouchella lonarensis]